LSAVGAKKERSIRRVGGQGCPRSRQSRPYFILQVWDKINSIAAETDFTSAKTNFISAKTDFTSAKTDSATADADFALLLFMPRLLT
jgi:hypothetical protein